MSDRESEPNKGITRTRIIQQAQQEVFEARSNYARAAATSADDARTAAAAADLHNAVVDYYQALEPLSDDKNIADEWDDVELWTETVPARTEDGDLRLVENGDGSTTVAMTEASVGLEGIERYIGATTERTETETGFLGTYEKTVAEPERLSPPVLFKAAKALDSIAEELGFAPSTPDYTPETEVTQDDIEAVQDKIAEWRRQYGDTEGGETA